MVAIFKCLIHTSEQLCALVGPAVSSKLAASKMHVHLPRTRQWNLIWKRVFVDVIEDWEINLDFFLDEL